METRTDRDLRTFGQLLRQARVEKGLSQAKLAQTLGIAQASVSAWEAGTAEPEREHVFLLEDLLGVGEGGLSRPLNYGRVPRTAAERKAAGKPNTRMAIQLDPSLTDAAKEVLLKNYSLLVRKRTKSDWTAELAGQELATAV